MAHLIIKITSNALA